MQLAQLLALNTEDSPWQRVNMVLPVQAGYATVVINKPDTIKRIIYFRLGKPMGADTSEADGYHEFRAPLENDLHFIRVGEERNELPNAAIWEG